MCIPFKINGGKMKKILAIIATFAFLGPMAAAGEEPVVKEEKAMDKPATGQVMVVEKPAAEAEKRGIEHGGFGAPVLKVSKLFNYALDFSGAKGGWIIDHHYVIGIEGYGASSRRRLKGDAQYALTPGFFEDEPTVDFSYGGLMFAYIIEPETTVHGSASVLVGNGSVTKRYRVSLFDESMEIMDGTISDDVLVAEPTLELEINATDWFRPCLGLSYRFVSGSDLQGIKNSDLSGFGGSIAFKFGKF
jgi:hypothetical protein